MNMEFHYWITLFLARRAGLAEEESRIIAHSSQFVDDMTYSIPIEGSRGLGEIRATQSYGSTDSSSARRARLAFHFIPGDRAEASALRLDGRAGEFVVTPNSQRAKTLLIAALKTRDSYRVGIALHAYADTWAHANFSGSYDETNAFDKDDPVPPLGHAPALKKPDLLNEIWEDPRLCSEYSLIVNRKRFIAASRMIYKYLRTYARRGFDDVDLIEGELEELWGRRGEKRRSERYADYAIALNAAPYDREAWLVEAGLGTLKNGSSGKVDELVRRGHQWLRSRLSISRRPVSDWFYASDLALWNAAAQAHAEAFSAIPLG